MGPKKKGNSDRGEKTRKERDEEDGEAEDK